MIATEKLPVPVYNAHYAACLEASRRIGWDAERDVIRGRRFDDTMRLLPTGLSCIGRFDFLNADEKRVLDHIQGRTYANMVGLCERFIGAKMLELSRDHWFGDQTALEALVRFAGEELKHQALFRRVDQLIAEMMAPGYVFIPDPDHVARTAMSASTWALLAFTCHIELLTQVHYRYSIALDADVSRLYRDVFMFHCREEAHHAVIDELEWKREDARISLAERELGVGDLIGLFGTLDSAIQTQAEADADCLARVCGKRRLDAKTHARVVAGLRSSYRWQFIGSGSHDPRFDQGLRSMVTAAQHQRVRTALAALVM